MRWMVLGLVLATGCKEKSDCEACPTEASVQACKDTVSICQILGPPGFPFRVSCVNDAHEACLAEDNDSGAL